MTAVTLEDYEFMKDPKYRLYVNAVDKALKSFEYSSEWADLISALGKLNKVLTTYTKYPAIPRRIKISKRLAQCMHPALPSGVHLKALETYDIIFRSMGTDRLSQELFIYSAGLFPLLGNAATNVKPTLLTIYETHFVPLGESLGPGLSGFLSGVLPGLEEGSDYFNRTNALLEMVCAAVNPVTFYGHLWDCLVSNAAVRLPAILFILSHFDKNNTIERQLHIMGTCIDTMVNGLCCCFHDTSVLVQRSALDFLLVAFPMNNSQLVCNNLQRLISSALVTILRRDMSLNRRLYAWLLGSEVHMPVVSPEIKAKKISSSSSVDSDFSEQYFEVYSKELLINAVKDILREATGENPHNLRPYRILISLLDKADIGPVILDDILYEVFRLFYLCSKDPGDKASNNTELTKHANLLFSALEPRYLWQYTGMLFSNACEKMPSELTEDLVKMCDPVNSVGSGEPSLLEVCNLTEFLLDSLALELYSETLTEHVPELFLYITTTLMEHCDLLHCHYMAMSLKLGIKILSHVRLPIMANSDLGYGSLEHTNSESLIKNKISEPGKIVQLKSDDNKITGGGSFITREREISPSKTELSSITSDSTSGIDVTSSTSASLETISPSIDVESITSNETLTEYCNDKKPNSESVFIPAHNQNIMDKCLKQYEKFYVTFVYCMRVKVGEIRNMDDLFQMLRIKSLSAAAEDRIKHLEELLQTVLYNDKLVSSLLENNYNYHSNEQLTAKVISLMKTLHSKRIAATEWIEAVSYASKLLLELSTFQTSVTNSLVHQSHMHMTDELKDEEDIPEWLKTLIVCSCWLGSVAAPLQLISINTLLELSLLCRRIRMQSTHATISSNNGVTPVMLISLLKTNHLEFIEYKTNVFQVITHWLWEHLGNPMFSVRVVELLHQLQSMLPSTDIIENCIAESSSKTKSKNERLLSFRKFATVWHIGREITRFRDGSKIDDIFYKSMLKMLDNLELEESNVLKIEAENWLFHTFLRGDTRRLLDALFIALLDPSTARVSVVHVRIQLYNTSGSSTSLQDKSLHFQQDTAGYKLYSITSADNVIYHISSMQSISDYSKCLQIPSVLPSPISQTDCGVFLNHKNGEQKTSARHILESEWKKDKSPSIEEQNLVALSQCSILKNNSFTSLECLKNTSHIPEINLVCSSADLSNLPFAKSSSSFGNLIGIKQRASNEQLISKDKMEVGSGCLMTRSLSFSGIKHSKLEFEDSEDFQLKHSRISQVISSNIVSEIIDSVLEQLERSESKSEAPCDKNTAAPATCNEVPAEIEKTFRSFATKQNQNDVDLLHSHMLLYYNIYDTLRIIYLFQTIRNIIIVNPRLFLISTSTTTIPAQSLVLQLFIRHRKSIFGRGFYNNVDSATAANRHSMYLEVLISTCLYYARSFYPHFAHIKLTDKQLAGNRQVQVASIELLTLISYHLCDAVRDSGRSLASYLSDLFSRCKVQKISLFCILSILNDINADPDSCSLTREIFIFNNERTSDRMSNYLETIQVHLLRLLLSLIILEYEISSFKAEPESVPVYSTSTESTNLHYVKNSRIPHQPVFLCALSKGLESNTFVRHLHHYWTSVVICSLPYLKKSLSKVVSIVTKQLCKNIEAASEVYIKSDSDETKLRLPPDYTIMQLESLTILCQYCLIDTVQPLNQPFHNITSVNNVVPLPVFISVTNLLNSSSTLSDQKEEADIRQNAKNSLINTLPTIIGSISVLWSAILSSKQKENENNVAGNSYVVKNQILLLLSKIASNHSPSFVASFAIVWKEKKPSNQSTKMAIPTTSDSQHVLAQLLYSVKSLSMDTLLHTIHQVIKQPPTFNNRENSTVNIEVSILELFAQYIHLVSVSQLTDSWTSLLPLLRDAPLLTPPSQFLLFAILNQFVQRTSCTRMERKDQKDLQDIIIKLVELCTQVAGACLEQTTWLRRNLAVRGEEPTVVGGILTIKDTDKAGSGGGGIAQYSVTALTVLAEMLAPLLDIAFANQEKERVVTVLSNLMYNVTPYLRNHTQKNTSSFYACSLLVSSISSYQYTRKAWKKDVMDLLLDPNLFQMEARSLTLWRTIVDNLMSQDTTTFRDLLGRISTSQGNSLSLFSSKDLEYEQRAQLLKRVAFVILCSEQDQFNKHMPDIQEKLAESLRLPQGSPIIQAQVFLCFRVLLLRMSPDHITSLWPIIVTEMVQVMLQMEHELLSFEVEEFSLEDSNTPTIIPKGSGRYKKRWHRKSGKIFDDDADQNNVREQNEQTNIINDNGLQLNTHSHWLQLQLAAAKLLKFAIQLPANRLPQFQMYKWAFVGNKRNHKINYDTSRSSGNIDNTDFVPHVTRITQLMDKKFGGPVDALPVVLLPSGCGIRTLQDLHPFFSALSRELPQIVNIRTLYELEHEIELDFIEPIPTSR